MWLWLKVRLTYGFHKNLQKSKQNNESTIKKRAYRARFFISNKDGFSLVCERAHPFVGKGY